MYYLLWSTLCLGCGFVVLALEKEYIDAAKINDVQTMKLLGRAVNVDAKNLVSQSSYPWNTEGQIGGCLYLSCFTHVQVCSMKWKCVFCTSLSTWEWGPGQGSASRDLGATRIKCLAQGQINRFLTKSAQGFELATFLLLVQHSNC